ncbi:MAG: DEAD/DEAH box helicase [Methanomassiliicoccales archaeon]|jgi:ATP-dependent RNA helicase DeaD|nr:DEAD/DEAH box helicase [Methanomassiliicoccales archaeon]
MVNSFETLGIDDRILKAISKMGFVEPTPVQTAAIPILMKKRDAIVQAQTGTGKTAAFAIPILQHINEVKKDLGQSVRGPFALVLVPTRELAIQVSEEMAKLGQYLKTRSLPVYGGQSISLQLRELERGVDVVIGTPGRIIDHLKRGSLDCQNIKFAVLDEADRMLDMGFIDDIKFIISRLPRERHTSLFSATIPDEIRRLAVEIMRQPETIIVSEEELVLPSTQQIYFSVGRRNKIWALCRVLDKEKPKAIIFCQTKKMVDVLCGRLKSYGYPVEAIHGDLPQSKREKVIRDFRKGVVKILIATDVAARGLDIEDVSLVVNYDIPESPEWYVHRIGRTGRAGKVGKAITFVSAEEKGILEDIQQFGKTKIEKAEVPETGRRDVVKKIWDFDEYQDIYGMVKVKIKIGRSDGLLVNDLVNIIVSNARINEILIGVVDIGEDETVFEVHKDVAFNVIKTLERMKIKGKSPAPEPIPREA